MANGLNNNELKEFLDSKYEQYNQKKFIESDPIQVPHNYTSKEDIEISSFLTATIAWGQRKTIIKNSFKNKKSTNKVDFFTRLISNINYPFKAIMFKF